MATRRLGSGCPAVPLTVFRKATLVAVPKTPNELLVAELRPLALAIRVWGPAVLRLRVLKVATPATAATVSVLAPPLSVPLPDPSASVMLAVEVLTRLPSESRTDT